MVTWSWGLVGGGFAKGHRGAFRSDGTLLQLECDGGCTVVYLS